AEFLRALVVHIHLGPVRYPQRAAWSPQTCRVRATVAAMIDVAPHLFTELLALPDAIFTRQDALRMDLCDQVLMGALRRGLITRICGGAYTAPGIWSQEGHRQLLAKAALRTYPDAVLTGATAVAAHGIPLFEVPVVRTDIARPITRE